MPTISILSMPLVSEFSAVFGPGQSWGIVLVMGERQDDCCSKLSGAVSMYCSF